MEVSEVLQLLAAISNLSVRRSPARSLVLGRVCPAAIWFAGIFTWQIFSLEIIRKCLSECLNT